VFDATMDYFVMPYNDVNDNNVMPDGFFERYSFLYREDVDSITSDDYDTLCIVYPPELLVRPVGHTPEFTAACAYHKEFIDKLLAENTFRNVLWFDNDDLASDPTLIYTCFKPITWFKRNYSTRVTYASNVIPFPFFMFGLTCPLWRVLHMPCVNPNKIDRIYWSGGSHGSLEKSYATREEIIEYMKPHMQQFFVYPADAYVAEVAKSKFSLDMNGAGDPNIRTFEILSCKSLRISQKSNIKWNFDDEFCEETIFNDENEFLEKIVFLEII
jgi:hypothetical protein